MKTQAEIKKLNKKIARLEKKYETAGRVEQARILKRAISTGKRLAMLKGDA